MSQQKTVIRLVPGPRKIYFMADDLTGLTQKERDDMMFNKNDEDLFVREFGRARHSEHALLFIDKLLRIGFTITQDRVSTVYALRQPAVFTRQIEAPKPSLVDAVLGLVGLKRKRDD